MTFHKKGHLSGVVVFGQGKKALTPKKAQPLKVDTRIFIWIFSVIDKDAHDQIPPRSVRLSELLHAQARYRVLVAIDGLARS